MPKLNNLQKAKKTLKKLKTIPPRKENQLLIGDKIERNDPPNKPIKGIVFSINQHLSQATILRNDKIHGNGDYIPELNEQGWLISPNEGMWKSCRTKRLPIKIIK